MKKIVYIFMFFQVSLCALDIQSTLNVYHEIFSSLLDNKKMIVYTKNDEIRKVFKFSKKIVLSDNIDTATIILISSKSDLSYIEKARLDNRIQPIFFSTEYKYLKESDNIVGAFYWKKGRSQLVFIKQRLEKFKIHLPLKYEDFIISKL